jgi:hypothetical protein
MKKGFRLLTAIFSLVLLCALILPVGLAYAEDPTHLSEVDGNVGGFGAPFQHHSFIDDGRQWVFYTNNSELVYSTSTDMVTWTAPTSLHYCGDAVDVGGDWQNGDTYFGTQFDLWYDSTNNRLDIALLNTSANNSAILYARFTPSSVTGLLTAVTNVTPWQSAVAGGGVNVSYRLPSICVTPSQQPIIAYTKLNSSASPVIDVGVIGFANPGTGSLMALTGTWPKYNLSATGNATAFGSVIPLLSGNVSIQFVQAESAEGYLKQAIISITGGTDTVGTDYYVDSLARPSAPGFLWDYSAVSVHTDAVTASGNEDVMIVWNKDEGATTSLQFNRLADSTDWDGSPSYAIELENDDVYIGALGLRDTVGNLVYSAISYTGSAYLYSWDYDLGTATLSTVDVIDEANGVQYAVMSNYNRDLEGDQNTGFIYQGSGYEVMYAAYEYTAPTPAYHTGVWTMAGVLPYIFVCICLILAVGMFATNNAVAGVVMLAIAVILTIVGTSLIQSFIP